MKQSPCPHPADSCEESCSTTSIGFVSKKCWVSTVSEPEFMKAKSCSIKTSTISQSDADAKALAAAKEQAALNLKLQAQFKFPEGNW